MKRISTLSTFKGLVSRAHNDYKKKTKTVKKKNPQKNDQFGEKKTSEPINM